VHRVGFITIATCLVGGNAKT